MSCLQRSGDGRDDDAAGKDACKGPGTRWVEPLVPGNAAAPFHPNARGMAGVTPAVVAAAR